MKKYLVFVTMVLAFNLSNAQDGSNRADVYLQGGTNLNLIFNDNTVGNYDVGFGIQHKKFDGNINLSVMENSDVRNVYASLNRVWVLHEAGLEFSAGGILGNGFLIGDDYSVRNPYYAPSVSLRLRPDNSKLLTFIIGAHLPQPDFDRFEWDGNDVQFTAKLRFNLQKH